MPVVNNPGLMNGKMGISIYFYPLARSNWIRAFVRFFKLEYSCLVFLVVVYSLASIILKLTKKIESKEYKLDRK